MCSRAGWAPLIGQTKTARIFIFNCVILLSRNLKAMDGNSYNAKLTQELICARFQTALSALGSVSHKALCFQSLFLRFLAVGVKQWPESRPTCHQRNGFKTIYHSAHKAGFHLLRNLHLGFPQNLKLLGRSWAHWDTQTGTEKTCKDQLDQCFRLWHKLSSVVPFESCVLHCLALSYIVLQVLPGLPDCMYMETPQRISHP